MKEFEQDFNDALSMDVNIDFKNIDSVSLPDKKFK